MGIEENKTKIIEACKKEYDGQKTNCNYFLEAVFLDVTNVTLTGTADDLVEKFSSPNAGWNKVERTQAIADQVAGKFVVAGLKSSDHSDGREHGHVAVVVSGPLYHSKYPVVWCGGGSLGRSNGNKTVGEVWATSDRDKVKYFTYKNF
jgi:hypothetical protein